MNCVQHLGVQSLLDEADEIHSLSYFQGSHFIIVSSARPWPRQPRHCVGRAAVLSIAHNHVYTSCSIVRTRLVPDIQISAHSWTS